jgi:predicted nuclease of predicted toxin-antitoxin system
VPNTRQTTLTVSTIKLFLDEDVWLGLASTMRERGFDVLHVYEVDRGEMSDADQLAYAAQEQRAILTQNAGDFVGLVREYYERNHSHAGVILSPHISKSELVRRTLNLLRALSAEEATDTVRHLSDYR